MVREGGKEKREKKLLLDINVQFPEMHTPK